MKMKTISVYPSQEINAKMGQIAEDAGQDIRPYWGGVLSAALASVPTERTGLDLVPEKLGAAWKNLARVRRQTKTVLPETGGQPERLIAAVDQAETALAAAQKELQQLMKSDLDRVRADYPAAAVVVRRALGSEMKQGPVSPEALLLARLACKLGLVTELFCRPTKESQGDES
jgi:hypothetical protein